MEVEIATENMDVDETEAAHPEAQLDQVDQDHEMLGNQDDRIGEENEVVLPEERKGSDPPRNEALRHEVRHTDDHSHADQDAEEQQK